MNNGLRCFRWIFISMIILFLSACSKDNDARQLGIDGYVYVADEISFPDASENNIISKLCVTGEYLYYTVYNKHSELKRTAIEDELSFENSDTILSKADGIYYTVDQEQSVYCFDNNTLIKYYENGTEAYRLSIKSTTDKSFWASTSKFLAADNEGRCFILSDDGIFLVDAQGRLNGKISTENYKPESSMKKEYLAQGANGKVYYCFRDRMQSRMYAWEIKYNSNSLEKADEAQVQGEYYSSEYGLCINKNNSFYQYQAEDASFHELFRWQDSCLDENISEIVQLSEDRFLVYYLAENEFYLLTRTKTDELPEKEIIMLACVTPSLELVDNVTAFNRNNDTYHISIETYTGTEGITLLDSRLASSDPPDLLDLSDLDLVKYARKQVLDDLNPYLEESSVVSVSDYLDNVIEGYTIDERLVCIPTKFWFYTAIGRTAQIGQQQGWTMDDVYALTEQYPEMQLFQYDDFDFILGDFCGGYIVEKFINWEEGTCSLDTEEFRSLVRWAKENSGGHSASSYDQVEDDVLLIRRQISGPSNYVQYEYIFGCPVTMAGYPSSDGELRYPVDIQDALGIVSKSSHKDGAWEFLEYYLGKEEEITHLQRGGFSTKKGIMEAVIEEESSYWYRDNDAGEQKMYPRTWFNIGGENIYYYCLTEEQAEAIRNVLYSIDFTPQGSIKQDVIDIILEEAGSYYDGSKPLEEITGIIQERVEILIQEDT